MSLADKKMPLVHQEKRACSRNEEAKWPWRKIPLRGPATRKLSSSEGCERPGTSRVDCPKNMREARERGVGATVEIGAQYRQGLQGLGAASHVAILTWLHHAPRNLIVQRPRHALESKGTFALRSPARPNPIGLHIVKLLSVDPVEGILSLDAIDVLDGTPVIDIKPYFASSDSIPDATYASSTMAIGN